MWRDVRDNARRNSRHPGYINTHSVTFPLVEAARLEILVDTEIAPLANAPLKNFFGGIALALGLPPGHTEIAPGTS